MLIFVGAPNNYSTLINIVHTTIPAIISIKANHKNLAKPIYWNLIYSIKVYQVYIYALYLHNA